MTLYRRPKFLEILHEIREEMSREVDYDVDLFAEMVRSKEISAPLPNSLSDIETVLDADKPANENKA